ncbi:site-specific DNA-methyltransferase [Kocuria indica]|uniref:DNA-methyltransferase n=1 Tax=Kocuria marina TaxID=223184 RepID=UPI001EF50A1B|nr:site-specific DNA-methyltransferase [Kocuria indica]MCG7432212.1 site-specific DNA-methyltransferase [Kocuria indica]
MAQWEPFAFDAEGTSAIVHGENLSVLEGLPDEAFSLVYLDPPFNTGRDQVRRTTRSVPAASGEGDRVGFAGRSYETIMGSLLRYEDSFADYLGFLEPRLMHARRVLATHGTLYVHLDYREVHYVKVLLDALFGRRCFLNEIIWAYDFGGRTAKRWPAKHDTILVYVKDPTAYHFNSADVDREPYMAPGLVGPVKAARGKLPTDVWWHTIVSPTGKEKTGYPTQKPAGVLRRIVTASSRPGDWVLDFFAGSGTTGAVSEQLGRKFVCVDSNPEAVDVMRRRLPDTAVFSAS